MLRESWSKAITDWQRNVFGDVPHSLTKAAKEWEELQMAISQGAAPSDIARECADIVICLAGYCYHLGFDLGRCVAHKLIINMSRVWHEQDDGTFQHVKNVIWSKKK